MADGPSRSGRVSMMGHAAGTAPDAVPSGLEQLLLDPARLTILSLVSATNWCEFAFVRDHARLSDSAHAPRRSQVVLVEPALSQLAKLTAPETHRLDRVIVAISVNPSWALWCPAFCCATTWDDVDGVRVIYYVTALRQITIVAYVEA